MSIVDCCVWPTHVKNAGNLVRSRYGSINKLLVDGEANACLTSQQRSSHDQIAAKQCSSNSQIEEEQGSATSTRQHSVKLGSAALEWYEYFSRSVNTKKQADAAFALYAL